jgi:hypothetical protein
LRLPRCFVRLCSCPSSQFRACLKSSSPLQKHEPPARTFRQASRESGPRPISYALSSGFSLPGIAKPNKSLGGTSPYRATGSRISSPLHGALIKTKPPCCRLRRFDRSYNASSLLHLNSNYATGAKALYRHIDTGTSATAQSLSFLEMLPIGPLSVWNFSPRWMLDCGVSIPTPT